MPTHSLRAQGPGRLISAWGHPERAGHVLMEGQGSVQVLMDDRLTSSQGGAPLGTLNLHDEVVKVHRVIPINDALRIVA